MRTSEEKRPSRKEIATALAGSPWASIEEASRCLGVHSAQIHRALHEGVRRTTGAATLLALEAMGLRDLCKNLTGVNLTPEAHDSRSRA